MGKHATLSGPTDFQLKLALGFLCSTLVMVVAIQLASGREPESVFGASAVFQLILFELIVGLLIVPVFFTGENKYSLTRIPISAAVLFSLFALISFFQIHDLVPVDEFFVNFTVMLLWIAGGILLFIQVTARTRNWFALQMLAGGFLLQLALSFSDVFGGLLWIESSSINIETLESALASLALVFYVVSLLASVISTGQEKSLDIGFGGLLSKVFFEAEYGVLGAASAIGFNNLQFSVWRQINRGKTFADFYAWQITKKLDKGRAHRTLGNKQFECDNLFGLTPIHDAREWRDQTSNNLVECLISLGLKPQHKLVDYGCGSLRIGKHLILQLDKGKYWGLDVTDRFFLDGLALLGKELQAEKAPRCRVITPRSLAEVGQERVDFVISIAVLKHVPERELDDYFDALTGLMTSQTTLAVTFSESTREKRISGKSWSWSLRRIKKLIETRCPDHQIKLAIRRPQKSRNSVVLNYCMIVATPDRKA